MVVPLTRQFIATHKVARVLSSVLRYRLYSVPAFHNTGHREWFEGLVRTDMVHIVRASASGCFDKISTVLLLLLSENEVQASNPIQ